MDCLHNDPTGARRTHVVVARDVHGIHYAVVYDGLPPFRSCCLDNPIERVRWWNAAADILERVTDVDVEWLIRAISDTLPLPGEEDELAFHMFTSQVAAGAPMGPAQRQHAARHAIDEAEAFCRPGDRAWDRACDAWRRAVLFSGWTAFRMMAVAAEAAAHAVSVERGSHRRRPEKVEEWTRIAAEWRAASEDFFGRAYQESSGRTGPPPSAGAAPSRASAERVSPAERVQRASIEECARLLELAFPFTQEDLKRAYRLAAIKHHPDRGGDPAQMVVVNLAFQRLSHAGANGFEGLRGQ